MILMANVVDAMNINNMDEDEREFKNFLIDSVMDNWN